MQKQVTKIPTRQMKTTGPSPQLARRKVAAYARVSTDFEDQITSYEAQVRHYEAYIKNRADWVFAGIYTDEGITGTSTAHREGFRKMVADALDGKIDLIITKSVSRFARNTVDSLSTIRLLKDHSVEVFFEKENIWTFDGKGEVLLTIMSSLAQEEARSTSENCKWGIRKRFAEGRFTMPYAKFLGYDKGPDGNPVVNREQAEVVKRIYTMFLEGNSIGSIMRTFNKEGVPAPGRGKKWCVQTIRSILSNEKYKGDVLLQKFYVPDFLTKKQVRNDGSVPQYYIKGNHEAIISPEVFDTVQDLLAYRAEHKTIGNTIHPFSGIVFCKSCGEIYGPNVWHSNDCYRKIVWRCRGRIKGKGCKADATNEVVLKTCFLSAVNSLIENKDTVIAQVTDRIEKDFPLQAMQDEIDRLEAEIEEIEKKTDTLINQSSSSASNQEVYAREYAKLEKKFNRLCSEADALRKQKTDMIMRQQSLRVFLAEFESMETRTEFRERDLRMLVERIETDGHEFNIVFKNGSQYQYSC